MYFEDKSVLIIGGTGTIGKKIAQEILKQNPKVVRIFSRDEYKQFVLANELKDEKRIRFLIGDVRDYERVERAMTEIDIVFNLAAMKHVPACEYNPEEAVKTNVIGVENVIKAAKYQKVESVVYTSSDKAINPTNAYGATKLLAEKLMQAANYSKGRVRTRFVAVRFGNVMGSRGSVIPLFKRQILEQRRITITNPQMSRFMMTLTQASRLTMQAAIKAVGGEVFVLKMPVIKLKDLADIVTEETCLRNGIPLGEVDIQTIGLRPGEKMYEELMTEEESTLAYDLDNMYAVLPTTGDNNKYDFYYSSYKKASIDSYKSSDEKALTKQQVKQLLTDERLLF